MRRVAAAELGRVARQQPAVVEHAAAASGGPSPGRRLLDRDRSSGLGLGRQVLVEERDELRAEGLDVSVEGQLHGAPGGKKIRKTSVIYQNENTILTVRKLQSLTR